MIKFYCDFFFKILGPKLKFVNEKSPCSSTVNTERLWKLAFETVKLLNEFNLKLQGKHQLYAYLICDIIILMATNVACILMSNTARAFKC